MNKKEDSLYSLDGWIIDSGASFSLTYDKEDLRQIKRWEEHMNLADGSYLNITGKGWKRGFANWEH